MKVKGPPFCEAKLHLGRPDRGELAVCGKPARWYIAHYLLNVCGNHARAYGPMGKRRIR